jgi:ADP-ribose pyrophosphatase YjhB (NUDIX family)
MKLLKTIVNCQSFPEINSLPQIDHWPREAARAVVFDGENDIAILEVGIHNNHKLPGGGIEKGEGPIEALHREMREEIGCEIEIIGEVGSIDEKRDADNFLQINYCFLARVAGEKGLPEFDQYEIERGFRLKWMTIDEAIKTFETDESDDQIGQFITARDLIFLKEAKKIMENKNGREK